MTGDRPEAWRDSLELGRRRRELRQRESIGWGGLVIAVGLLLLRAIGRTLS